MAISVDDIVPAGTPAAEPAPTTPTPAEQAPEGKSTIPDDVLAIPAMRALLQGTPPALSAPVGDTSPEAKAIEAAGQQLMEAGFGFYASKDGKKNVIFNIMQIEPTAIKLADQKGELDTIAPPLAELNQALMSGGKGETPASAAPPVEGATAPMPSGAPTAPPLTRARIANATVGGPTDGPTPGQGRILSNILKTSV